VYVHVIHKMLYSQGRRQVKKCGVDKHGERTERKLGSLGADPPAESRGRTPTPPPPE